MPDSFNRSGSGSWPFGPVAFVRTGLRNGDMEARPTLRCVLSLVALAAAVAALSACGGGGDARAAKDPPLAKYADQFVSFTYPSAWAASAPKGPSEMHFHPLVYLSTQSVGAPCVRQGNETRCDWPIKSLDAGGVLALWQIPYQLPTVGKVVQAGKQIEVGGRPAWIQNVVGGDCRRIGADRTIDVDMAEGLGLIVCVRDPGVAQAEMSVNALLASVKFASQ
jgi:hypothetical protein